MAKALKRPPVERITECGESDFNWLGQTELFECPQLHVTHQASSSPFPVRDAMDKVLSSNAQRKVFAKDQLTMENLLGKKVTAG